MKETMKKKNKKAIKNIKKKDTAKFSRSPMPERQGQMKPYGLKSNTGDSNRADKEMGRLMKSDVFRSHDKTIKSTNSNKRRYK